MPFGHLPTSLVDGGNVQVLGLSDEFQGEVYLVGFHIVDITLMLKVLFQFFHKRRKLGSAWDGDG